MRVVVLVSLVAMSALVGPAHSETDEQLQARQKAACLGDAIRLCGWHMPFVEQVKDCMKDKKKEVSKACAAFYPAGE